MTTEFHYLFRIEYCGSSFKGWQIQNEARTIQGHLNEILNQITSNGLIKTIGSSRTDSGVHALDQVVKVVLSKSLDISKMYCSLNKLLDPNIKIKSIVLSDHEFHPLKDIDWKEYHYYFHTKDYISPFLNNFIQEFPYRNFNFLKMQSGCKALVGNWDFKNFYCKGSHVVSSKREILSCDILSLKDYILDLSKENIEGTEGATLNSNEASAKIDSVNSTIISKSILFSEDIANLWIFRIRSKGFLKQMVRLLMDAMWRISCDKLSLEHFKEGLEGKYGEFERLSRVAPASGLCLVKTQLAKNVIEKIASM